jgi:lipopolysaccharide/colanic/teichoic acid biosynthesis glycosyltransferase
MPAASSRLTTLCIRRDRLVDTDHQRPTVEPLAAGKLPSRRAFYLLAKRAVDVVAAGAGLLLLSPALLAAAIAVRLDSPGPILFKQQRIGRNFRPFAIYKFRTMVEDADRRGGQITAHQDPRVTRVGRWLRRSKLDELPQLINVLVGHMSLVGPRPEVPKFVEIFHDEFVAILSVRPGITDPASIKYRDEAALLAAAADPESEYARRILPDKLEISKRYLATATMASDLGVILRTALRSGR